MFTSWDRVVRGIRTRLSLESSRAPGRRRPAAFHTGFEPLEDRTLLAGVTSIPYWCGIWAVTVTPPSGSQFSANLQVLAENLDEDTGWINSLYELDYNSNPGNLPGYGFTIPDNENPGNATISGTLTSDAVPSAGTFTLTANANQNPATVPDSFTGSFTVTGSQPTMLSGSFEAPPNNPSLTSALDYFSETEPRARPVLSFNTQPVAVAVNETLPPVQVGAPNGSVVTLTVTNSAGVTVPGTTGSATAANGVATFNNLSVSQPGTFTLLATSAGSQNGISAPFTVKTSSPKISSLSNYVAPNFVNASFSGTVVETVTGSGFQPGATVSLGDITASRAKFINSSTLQVTLTGFQNLSQGFRTVTVTNPDGGTASLTGSQGFYVSSLVLEPMEISQGVTVTGSQPEIAEHTTVVRVQVESNSSSAAAFNTLDIHLLVQYTPPGSTTAQRTLYSADQNPHAKKIPPYQVQTLAAVASAPPTPLTQFYAQDSFNFTLTPAELPAGNYVFTVEVDPVNPKAAVYGYGASDDNAHLLFEASKPLSFQESTGLMNVAVMFDLPGPKNRAAFKDMVLNYFNFVRDAYPISADRVEVTVVPPVVSTQKSFLIVDRTLRELRSYYNTQLEERTAQHLAPFTSVVLFEDNQNLTSDGDLGATDYSSRSGVRSPTSIVSATDPTSLAHELGHQFGLGDTYVSRVAQPSSNNPRQPGAPDSGNLVDYGNYDFYTQTVAVRDSPYPLLDFMGNGNDSGLRWIDNQTWNYLYPKFNSPASSSGN
jgi:hypothetical protein